MSFNNRLRAIANEIPEQSTIVDVGSDHGYLSVLLSKKNCKHIFNIENKQGPLNQTIMNTNKYQINHLTTNILQDGLSNEIGCDPDYIVISGMGGINMIDILNNTKVKINNIILSPNNNMDLVKSYLLDNNFELINEKIVEAKGNKYPIFIAKNKK